MDNQKKFDYYENVTENAISNLREILSNGRADTSTWSASIPVNGVTGMSYTTDSKFLLMLKQQGKQNEDPRFFTYNQIKDLGYFPKYGAKSTNAVAVQTRDENGNLLSFDKQKKHFENVFHASDIEQHIYKKDNQGNKLPLLDKEGNPRYSKKDNSPLYRYDVLPIPAFEPQKKWQVNISSALADNIFTSTQKMAELREKYDGGCLHIITKFSKMMLEAETDIKFPADENSLNIQQILDHLQANKGTFSDFTKQARELGKSFKDDIKKELAKAKEADEEIPFDIPDTEKSNEPADKTQNAEADIAKESSNSASDKAEIFMESIGNNLVQICCASMKAQQLNTKEMLSVLETIKERSTQMLKSNDNSINNAKMR